MWCLGAIDRHREHALPHSCSLIISLHIVAMDSICIPTLPAALCVNAQSSYPEHHSTFHLVSTRDIRGVAGTGLLDKECDARPSQTCDSSSSSVRRRLLTEYLYDNTQLDPLDEPAARRFYRLPRTCCYIPLTCSASGTISAVSHRSPAPKFLYNLELSHF